MPSIRVLAMSDLHIEFEERWRRQVAHVARQGKPAARPAAQARVDAWAALPPTHPRLGPDLTGVGQVDVVLLAGDIAIGVEAVEYAAEVAAFLGRPVCLTPGNHEFYKLDLQGTLADMRACAAATKGRVALLDQDRADLVVRGYRVAVLGATLWTDYALNGDATLGMLAAAQQLNDHRLIRWSSGDARTFGVAHHFRPQHAQELHRQARAWLTDALPAARRSADVVLVMSHHGVVAEANPPQYRGGPLCPAFASDMAAEVAASCADLWVTGHTHNDLDVTLGKTRLVSRQRGYLGEEAGAENFLTPVFDVRCGM